MGNRILKIGVMGCANIAGRSVIPAIKANSHFELVAVASRTAGKAEEFAARFNCKAVVGYENLLLEALDAVYMPLPTGLHEAWTLEALGAGMHVLAEKSFGMDAVSTAKMTALARQKGLVVMEDFMFEHHSQHAFLMRMLTDGTIGTIRRFSASFGFPGLPKGNFRYDPALGGGALLDAGAYTVKAAQLVLGQELQVLASTLQYGDRAEADVAGSALLVSADGIPAQLSWGFSHFYQCGYEIWGTKGKITTNRSFTAAPGFQPSLTLELNGETRDLLLPADNHFLNILSVFAGRIYEGAAEPAARELDNQSRLLTEVKSKALTYDLQP
jgi:dTDP-3,4-didehydro-2,6-dideoxy-alpha-D-glucose 3-reductase